MHKLDHKSSNHQDLLHGDPCPHLYDDIHETLSCIDSMHKSNHKASNHHNKEYRTIIEDDLLHGDPMLSRFI